MKKMSNLVTDSTAAAPASPRPGEDDDSESVQSAVKELSDDEMSSVEDSDSISDTKDETRQQQEARRSEGQWDQLSSQIGVNI